MESNQIKLPAHVMVYRQLRDMILCGELAPGQAVTIQGLVNTLGAGMTPVREAIRRLTSEGALEFQGNRRVCVPELTTAQLDEIAYARLAIEPKLAFWAAEKVTPEDIHALSTIDQALNASIDRGDIRGYLYQNHRFHTHLYSLSDAKIMIGLANTLWLRAAPSLRVVCGRFGTANLPDMHAIALQHLRDGDVEAVAEDMRQDIRQGIEQIRETMIS
ncbi:GntR family transcriptional regulator [Qingshengfaniella alkalisoli]|uniref:GntR family transcriptional regulator n=1 Tax=Qingshengfaniella alkalisoli TaxID=2599296 RepID=A0A5B8JBT5_9RHOB|nr:GntR family transcriptional regulator [Qingshengfaniella alkalisoli]QDY71560.1 GntR family transcriptional regulator [Qingshengfaniella alkalisoli]